jgi:uncharacterized repeat protein (TIGR01451 family)
LGIYKTRLDTSEIPFDILCPASQNYIDTLAINDTLIYNRNFALKCKNGYDVGAWTVASPNVFRPAWFSRVNIYAGDIADFYGAHCAAGISGTVQVVMSGPISYSGPAPNATAPNTVNGDTLLWNVTNFGTIDLFTHFNVIVQTDTAAIINSQICFTVTVTSNQPGDYNPANASLTHCFVVTGSYDPNDKAAFPVGYIDINGGRWLTYTVRFQNTGTAAAEHIYVIDTLDASLDLSTFQLLAYSHQPYVQVLEGGIARFNFPNINLPDSNSNEPASHGFIQYKIKFLNGLPAGTQIQNTAYIHFDFNPPVVTNTTVNTLIDMPAASIAGGSPVCAGSCTNISASAINGAPPYNYLWTPNIGTGAGPFSVCPSTTTTYIVTVTDANNITSSSFHAVTVNPLPTASITPSGPTTFCQGNSVMLTSSAASSYLWSDNSTGQSINVTASGIYVVTVTDANNCSSASPFTTVTVNPNPPVPAITQAGDSLISDAATTYQWYFNSVLIPGAISQSYHPMQNGNYSVVITDINNCTASSADYPFTLTATQNLIADGVFVYPNPAGDVLTITSLELMDKSEITIYNLLGESVLNQQPAVNNQQQIINISGLSKGVYFLEMKTEKGIWRKKFMKM